MVPFWAKRTGNKLTGILSRANQSTSESFARKRSPNMFPRSLISFQESHCGSSLLLSNLNYSRGKVWELSRWFSGKESACQCRRHRFGPWVEKIPWRRKWPPTPVFLLGESHGQRSLVKYSPWGHRRVGHDSVTKQQHKSNRKYPTWEIKA